MRRPAPFAACLAALTVACGGAEAPGPAKEQADGEGSSSCPPKGEAPERLPGVRDEHRAASYWVARAAAPDATLLDARDIARHNAGLHVTDDGEPLGPFVLGSPIDPAALAPQIEARIAHVRDRLASGAYLGARGERLDAADLGLVSPYALRPGPSVVHRATGPIAMHCAPTNATLLTKDLDPNFDRNLCSTAREGELVEVLEASGPLRLARTTYTFGWIDARAPLSAPIPAAELESALPRPKHGVLTRRALLETAFSYLDSPYGWGGARGGRDCSQFLLDVFAGFGIHLPRNSARQAIAGSFSVDVTGAPDRDKLAIFDAAHEAGAVLLHFPGHIMLYLGRDAAGVPMAIHSFAEYVRPCEGGGETLLSVGRVTVSDLSLGAGSSRRSFLERTTRVTVLGRDAGGALEDVAVYRGAAAPAAPPTSCADHARLALFRSPAQPHARARLSVFAVSAEPTRAADLFLFDPSGARAAAPTARVAGPPWLVRTAVERPTPGTWTAVLADGDEILACERIRVAPGPMAAPLNPADASAWRPRLKWEADTELLYAAWVRSLFDYPMDEGRTWTNLQTLLGDRDRNLLFDHLGEGEDAAIRLTPDCADLPYFLRATFAWKLGLPFAFRRCSRGRAGVPPACGDPTNNLEPTEGTTRTERFSRFIRTVASGVHSASARSLPTAESTDTYPVALTRDALLPGTVFADPYGHLLVISGFTPQVAGGSGVLIGAEAQPDGTIGRRQFWEGTFLFTPETRDVGAGFKAWRPLTYDAKAETLTALPNDELRASRVFTPFSLDAYTGTKDAFYAKVEALSNPRPRDPRTVLGARVAALEEAVTRRVLSVQNGVDAMNASGWRAVPMPEGYAVFETEGPWEDFATPARDLRLLIALDTVLGFPARVARDPAAFGVPATNASAEETRLAAALTKELAARRWTYTNSSGAPVTLTLADVVTRKAAFEMSYNPNDCPEVRWGAPEGSAELATCAHRAPADQLARMGKYRAWFASRTRPPR